MRPPPAWVFRGIPLAGFCGARAEDSRMICERIKPVGSNRPQNKCLTVAERRRQRERAQQQGIRAER